MGRSTKTVRCRRVLLGVLTTLGVAVLSPAPAALAAPGDLDPGFGGAAHGRVGVDVGTLTDLSVQPDGRIVLVGFDEQGSESHGIVARLRADGRVDDRFGSVGLPGAPLGADQTSVPEAAAVQSDGRIVLAGHVTDGAGHQDLAVWRVMPTGKLDSSFGPNGDGLVQFGSLFGDDAAADVALGAHGRILVAGTVTDGGTGPDLAVLRLTASGAFDPSFNKGQSFFVSPHAGVDFATSVATQPADGEVLIGGAYAGEPGNVVVRVVPGDLMATGAATLDDSFGSHGVASVPGTMTTNDGDVAVTSDGHILFLDQISAGGAVAASVVRLSSAGFADRTFGSPDGTGAHLTTGGPRTTAEALSLLPHGGVVVVGADDIGDSFVAKLRPTGRPDLRMGPGGVKTLPRQGLALIAGATQPDGRIVSGGNTGVVHVSFVYRLRGDLRPPACGGKTATIVGTSAADTLVGTGHADVIAGLGGGDTITGLGKGDVICGGAGQDHLSGGAGADHLYGGRGLDVLRGGPGRDVIRQ